MSDTAPSRTRPIAALLVVALLILLGVTMFNLQATKQQLERMTMRMDNNDNKPSAESKEEAKKVIAKLRAVYALPEGAEPTVAAIVDVDTLRQKNAFYAKAKNGDYLVVTTERAILFDATQSKVLDVIPVQLQPVAPASTTSSKPAAKKPAPAAVPTPAPTPTTQTTPQ
jgi:hypothetical protein